MIFGKKSLHVIIPLYFFEGSRYTEPVQNYESDENLDCIYKITAPDQDWLNPIADG